MPKPTTKPKPALSEAQLTEIRRRLNCAIHEIVFATHHADNDAPEDATNALMTAGSIIEEVSEEICTTCEL